MVRLWDFSETSQTAWLLTREHGLIRGLAKGSRRPKAKFSGGLDLLTLGEAVAIIKPSSDLAEWIEWDLREVFRSPRRRLEAHHAAMRIAHIAGRVVIDHDPHPRLFAALLASLRRLEHAAEDDDATLRRSIAEALTRFFWAALAETGYRPRLQEDSVRGGPLAPAETYGFSATLSGLTSDPGPDADPNAGVWRVRAETVEALRETERQWAGGPVAPLGDSRAVDGASRLLSARLSLLLDGDSAFPPNRT